jgi:hypothetical protein
MVTALIQDHVGMAGKQYDDLISQRVYFPAGPIGREVESGHQQVSLEVVKAPIKVFPDRFGYLNSGRGVIRPHDHVGVEQI